MPNSQNSHSLMSCVTSIWACSDASSASTFWLMARSYFLVRTCRAQRPGQKRARTQRQQVGHGGWSARVHTCAHVQPLEGQPGRGTRPCARRWGTTLQLADAAGHAHVQRHRRITRKCWAQPALRPGQRMRDTALHSTGMSGPGLVNYTSLIRHARKTHKPGLCACMKDAHLTEARSGAAHGRPEQGRKGRPRVPCQPACTRPARTPSCPCSPAGQRPAIGCWGGRRWHPPLGSARRCPCRCAQRAPQQPAQHWRLFASLLSLRPVQSSPAVRLMLAWPPPCRRSRRGQ